MIGWEQFWLLLFISAIVILILSVLFGRWLISLALRYALNEKKKRA